MKSSRWALADQGGISAANFLASVVLARALAPTKYGAIAVGLSTWVIVLAIVRSLVMQPYTIESSPLKSGEWHRATAASAGTLVWLTLVGVMGGAILALSDVLGEVGHSVGSFLLLSPFLVLADFYRTAAYTRARADIAFLISATQGVVQLAWLGMLLFVDGVTVALAAASWGIGAVAAMIAGCILLKVPPRLGMGSAVLTLRSLSMLGKWFVPANFLQAFSAQTLIYIAAWTGDRAGSAGVKVVSSLCAPIMVLLAAAESVLLPWTSVQMKEDPSVVAERLRLATMVAGSLLTTYIVALALFGTSVLNFAFGVQYGSYDVLILPIALSMSFSAIAALPLLSLRALGRGERLLRVQLAHISAKLIAGGGLTVTLGLVAGAWGIAAVSIGYMAAAQYQCHRVLASERE